MKGPSVSQQPTSCAACVQKSGSKCTPSAMHVLLLLISCVPGGGASTSASLEVSLDSKSPGRALAKAGPSSCRDVWGGTKCAGKKRQCASKKKVRKNCEATCEICTPSSTCADAWAQKKCKKKTPKKQTKFCDKGKNKKNCKVTCGDCPPEPPAAPPSPPMLPPPPSPPPCEDDPGFTCKKSKCNPEKPRKDWRGLHH